MPCACSTHVRRGSSKKIQGLALKTARRDSDVVRSSRGLGLRGSSGCDYNRRPSPQGARAGRRPTNIAVPPGPPAILLAVDPAARSGFAVWCDGRLREAGSVETDTVTVNGLVLRAGLLIDDDCVLAIECHTLPRNWRTAVALAEARRTWEVVAELMGWRVERVNAQTWQGALLGAGVTATRKARARALAGDVMRRDHLGAPIDDNAADAVCLGVYWLREFTRRGTAP